MPIRSSIVRYGWLMAVVTACGPRAEAQAQSAGIAEPGAAAAVTDTTTAARLSGAFRAAADRALPAVVSVTVEQRAAPSGRQEPRRRFPFDIPGVPGLPERPEPGPQSGGGSGFILDERGYIVTNRHVVRGADMVTVRLYDGREYEAEVVGADPSTDVAVIRIEADGRLPVVTLGDSDRLRIGDWVMALGNPLGLGFTVTAGIVSAKGRSLGILRRETETALEAFIQTDAAINPGNSGGPLIDLHGRVVGVNTAIMSPTGFYSGYGFAIPIQLTRRVAEDLIEHGVVRRPRLGVQIADVNADDAAVYGLESVAGAEVVMIQPGTPAEEAGLELGDVIVALDGEPVDDAAELTTHLARRQPGDRVRLTLVRDGERRDVTVELGQFEAAERRARERGDRPRMEELLGFSALPLTPERAAQLGLERDAKGVIVARLGPLSPAGRQGLVRGDVVVRLNGRRIESIEDLEAAAAELEPGAVVSLVVRKRGAGGAEQIINYRTRR